MDDSLLAYRSRFPSLAHTNYLISNSLGAVPNAAYASVHDYVDTWAQRGVRAWEETWWSLVAELGDLVAPLIGARPGDVVFQPNVTLAHAVVFSAYDFHGGRPKIVTDAMHFPSILYLIAEQQAHGAEVVIVPSDDGIIVDTQRVVDAIDERTACVALSHVLFKSAYVHDLAPIAARARRMGAVTIIDGYQSVGTLPVDVAGLDIYIGGCLKWLCGGPGAAFLWVSPECQRRLLPRLTGWMAHTRPFDFAPAHERRADIWRFLHGTPNIPAFYAARPGLAIVNEIGIAAIRAKSERQTARLLELAEAHGFLCTTPRDPARRGGTVAIDVPHGYEVSRALKTREILCDYRPGAGVRLSPHFYTRDDELDAAVEALTDILESEAWRAFAGPRATVTCDEAMIYDLTPAISERLCVWPGDTPPAREVLCDMKRGANLTLSTLHATVHLGAHADAPSHYGKDAPAIHERDLEYYVGPCQVVRIPAAGGSLISPEQLPAAVTAERLLLATGTYPDPEQFNEDFAALIPELVDWLYDRGVRLVGIDTPSVDPFTSVDLPAHKAFLKHDMAILEGLVLADVPEGTYELIALPLKLVGFDASPVRAILRHYPA